MESRTEGTAAGTWLVVLCAALLLAITMGQRSAFGLFVSPLNSATGLGVATISFASAVSQLVWGAAQPVAGMLADRYGPARVVVGGGLLLAAGSALIPFVDSGAGLVFALALGAIAGTAAGSNAVLIGTVNRRIPEERRGLATGIVGAGGSAGQLVIAPAAAVLIAASGWVNAMLGLAALSLAVLPLARGLRGGDAPRSAADASTKAQARRAALGAALRSPNYWLLTAGFFVCGFHVSFLLAHMPGVIELCGLPAGVSGVWLAIVGLCNVFGSVASGALTRWMPMTRMLTVLYAARGLGVAVFLLMPKSQATLLGFAVWMGLTYMATLPPTSGLIGRFFGVERLATLLGVTMFVHQIGSFLGVWLGGLALEATGGYDLIWFADIALAVMAAVIHLPLREPDPSGAEVLRTDAGQRAVLRSALPGDAAAIDAFVRSLSEHSREQRLFGAARASDAGALGRVADPDPSDDLVLVAFEGAEARGRIVAIAQYAGDRRAMACEVAVVVADDWQGQGLGRMLMERVVAHARESGFEEIRGEVLVDNRPMLRLARRSGFEVSPVKGDPAIVQITRALADAFAARGFDSRLIGVNAAAPSRG